MNCIEFDPGWGRVKQFLPQKMREPEGEFVRTRYRISYYLQGCFARGAHFMLWDHAKFSRATRTRKPLSAKHVARVWVKFVELSPNWRFEKIRLGRSFRWKITKPGGEKEGGRVDGEHTDREIRARLSGYILGAAKTEGRLRVGDKFLGAFCKVTAIPPERARAVLPSIRRIQGLRLSIRRGLGGAYRLKVSHPHFAGGISSPTGRRKKETTCARGAPDLPNRDSSGLRPQPGGLRPRAFAVKGRWISDRRLFGLACCLSTGPMKAAHAPGQLVTWRFPHARNLAFHALHQGHAWEAIVRAYGAGLERSHADARDKGEAAPREPSAAVSYAWRLLQDGRSSEARWAAFFATEPSRRDFQRSPGVRDYNSLGHSEVENRNAGVNPAAIFGSCGGVRAGGEVGAAALRPADLEAKKARLAAYLDGKGLKMADFIGMPYAVQRQIFSASGGFS